MPRTAFALLLCAAAASAQEWRGAERELREAIKKKDQPAMHAAARKLAEQRGSPGDPNHLACMEALGGAAQDALQRLQKLAQSGLVFDVAADPDLIPLRQLPGFEDLKAKFAANGKPAGAPRKVAGLPAGIIAEDIAHDAKTGRT